MNQVGIDFKRISVALHGSGHRIVLNNNKNKIFLIPKGLCNALCAELGVKYDTLPMRWMYLFGRDKWFYLQKKSLSNHIYKTIARIPISSIPNLIKKIT